MNKNFRGFAFILSTLIASAPALNAATVVNRTIATVNGEAVLLSEFNKNWAAFSEQQKAVLPADKLTSEWEKETKTKILEQMIADKILLQEAKKKKVRVNQSDLVNGVIQVKARFLPEGGRRDLEAAVQRQQAGKPQEETENPMGGMDLGAAWQELAKSNPGAVKEAESKFKDELVKEGLTDKKFEERIKDQLSVVQLTSQEVRSRNQPPTDDQAKKLFEQVQSIIDGKPLKNTDPEAQTDLESMAKFFSAQTGERVRARHILVRVAKDASFKDKSAAQKKLEDIRKKILAGADFAELAEKNSDDKASAVQGGDLGAFSKGQMVPEFEKTAFSLPVGQVSPIVETAFGLHIIKVEEKRAASKLRYEDVSNELKEYLYRASAQTVFENYVNELRKNSTIKLNGDINELTKKS